MLWSAGGRVIGYVAQIGGLIPGNDPLEGSGTRPKPRPVVFEVSLFKSTPS